MRKEKGDGHLLSLAALRVLRTKRCLLSFSCPKFEYCENRQDRGLVYLVEVTDSVTVSSSKMGIGASPSRARMYLSFGGVHYKFNLPEGLAMTTLDTIKECKPKFESIITGSDLMLPVFDQASRAAKVDATVLIMGESGTGKELIAEAIHTNSPRRDGPFVIVNMAAVPENLIESELFGHVAGAFTGSTGTRTGKFEAADKGTLFIDEIGDLALECQAKLLRVLENHCVTPVGSNEDRSPDVRVIAATNRNLEKMVH